MRYFLLLFSSVFILSCDQFIKLTINNQESFTYEFDCGTTAITAIQGVGLFRIDMKFNLKNPITIKKNKLTIKKNDSALELTFYDSRDKIINVESFSLNGKSEISIFFEVPGGVKPGDKITANANNSIFCNGKAIDIPPLLISV